MSGPSLSIAKQALLALDQMRERLAAAEQAGREPVAVIGIGLRVPGANDLESFWTLLRDGVDATSDIPSGRWDVEAYFDPDPDALGKIYTKRGGFITGVDTFDAEFFGVSPREARSMDPQHRLLLEVAWEAIEHAGIAPTDLSGSRTGVFVGVTVDDYLHLLVGSGERRLLDAYAHHGNVLNAAAGRLSYVLGLHGPSMAIDTACSSSLVATHLACQSLRSRESDIALAGGVNLLLSPLSSVRLARGHMLAPDGRCKTFDASADGYARAEGCGVLMLKRLAAALADGDRVLAVIRGSAVNQDGHTSALTVPSGLAQRTVIRDALANAGLEPADVAYVEAHGTGTALGDPIEMEAIADVLGSGRRAPLLVGSVKTNIGHLESASGVAGIIKVVLALQHGLVPPHLHFRTPSPHIPWADLPVTVPTAVAEWPQGRRIAGVSSFGASGTNAHVLLEQAPEGIAPSAEPDRSAHVLALSAESEAALRELAGRYAVHFDTHPGIAARDVCYTAAAGRAHFVHRAAIVGRDIKGLRDGAGALAEGRASGSVLQGVIERGATPKIAFLFTGQGSQYWGMGRELFETEPAFRSAIEECDLALQPHLDVPLLKLLFDESSKETRLLDRTAYTQPALFSVEYALARMLAAWGVVPAAVMGHSVGEYAAACVAGVLTLADAARMVAVRGRLMQALPQGGAMVAIATGETAVRTRLAPYAQAVSIAAVNAPDQIVLSGDRTALDALLNELSVPDADRRWLVVSHAFHSPLMRPMLDAFEAEAAIVVHAAPRLPFVSNLTGAVTQNLDARYWRQHAAMPVRFADGVKSMAAIGCTVFVEIGPTPALLPLARRCLDGATDPGSGTAAWVPTLRRGRGDGDQMTRAIGALYVAGALLDWRAASGNRRRRPVTLPTYPFARERHWIDAVPAARQEQTQAHHVPAASRTFLGARLESPRLDEVVFQSEVGTRHAEFLDDHRVLGRVIFPAAGFLELAAAAAREAGVSNGGVRVSDFEVVEALAVSAETPRRLQVIVAAAAAGGGAGIATRDVEIFSAPRDAGAAGTRWTLHARGGVAPAGAPTASDLDGARSRCRTAVPADAFYERLQGSGFDFGPAFRVVTDLKRGASEAVARLAAPAGTNGSEFAFAIHPALLDGCIQAIVAAAAAPADGAQTWLPIWCESATIWPAAAAPVWAHARVSPQRDGATIGGDVRLLTAEGIVVAEMAGLRLAPTTRDALAARLDSEAAGIYELAWQSGNLPDAPVEIAPAASSRPWIVWTRGDGVGAALLEAIAERGWPCVKVVPGAAFRRDTATSFEARPSSVEDVEAVCAAVAAQIGTPANVVFASGADARIPADATVDQTQAYLHDTCGAALSIVQALCRVGLAPPPRLWIVTDGAVDAGGCAVSFHQSALLGLARTIAREHPEIPCVAIDVDPSADPAAQARSVLLESNARTSETQVAFRDGQRYVARLVRAAQPSARRGQPPAAVMLTTPGAFDAITQQPVVRQSPGHGEIEIEVVAAGVNFRDVLRTLGLYPDAPGVLGDECAGRVVAAGSGVTRLRPGDDVFAFAPASMARYVTCAERCAALKPSGITFEQAAGLPVTFLTAVHSLLDRAALVAGERVLIHAAAGGVGLAAVQIARRAGAEIFATAGSETKRAYLRSLGIQHVMSSRSMEFVEEVNRATGGAGVSVVLNSLIGEFIPANLSVLAAKGRFIEIGKNGIWTDAEVAAVRPDVRYEVVYLGDLRQREPETIARMLDRLNSEITGGRLVPPPTRVFPFEHAVPALRHMSQARHIGKVVLSLGAPEGDRRPAVSSTNATYVVTGGLGGAGFAVAEWLAANGAKHLALVGRHEPAADVRSKIGDLEARSGARVRFVRADAGDRQQLAGALALIAATMPVVRGVVHAAGTLDDGVLADQQWTKFEHVLAPKAVGALNLHALTSALPLDFFALFSSFAGLAGSAGQANYASANTFLDGLAQYRRSQGLPAVSIAWGPWKTSTGMLARLEENQRERWSRQGLQAMAPEQALASFDRLLTGPAACAAVLDARWPEFLAATRRFADPLFERLVGPAKAAAKAPARASANLLADVTAAPATSRRTLLIDAITKHVQQVFGTDGAKRIDPRRPLRELGLDSLMAVEVRNVMAASLARTLPATLLFDYPAIENLADYVLRQFVQAGPAAVEEASITSRSSTNDLEALERLTVDEAEELLLAELNSGDDR